MTTPAKLEIDPEIMARTECDKGFVCLGEHPVYCSVLATLGHNMVKLECSQQLPCRHNKVYGALQACNCPVRHEIFTKYGQ
ncbi:MAG: hypothetical protein HGA96_13735 [Desulfobulbaceae bacterium]|nr:hypothetical protein [Desulfobulbaceae bacterium]